MENGVPFIFICNVFTSYLHLICYRIYHCYHRFPFLPRKWKFSLSHHLLLLLPPRSSIEVAGVNDASKYCDRGADKHRKTFGNPLEKMENPTKKSPQIHSNSFKKTLKIWKKILCMYTEIYDYLRLSFTP